MKKILEFYGTQDINSPRKVFAAAFQNNLIADLELWNSFIEKRARAEDAYTEQRARTFFVELPLFNVALANFLVTIERF